VIMECVLAAVLPVTSASPRSAWDIGGAIGNMVYLVPCAPAPTSVYIALPQGPTNHILVGRSRSGCEKGSHRAVGLDRVEINLPKQGSRRSVLLFRTEWFIK
jgi:hypothetical protein